MTEASTQYISSAHSTYRPPKRPALRALSSELAWLDQQVTALLKKQDELLWQNSLLEVTQEVSPLVVVPATSLCTLGDGVLTPAPPGPWERQCCRGPFRPSPPPQPIFTPCNRFGPPQSPTPGHGLCYREVLKEHYQTLLDTAKKKTDARIVITEPLPTFRRGSEQFSRLFALQAGAPSTAWAMWTTSLRSGSSQRSTGGMGFILVVWDLLSSHGTSRGPSTDYKAKAT
ncbi:hypothetical protein AOLI_G00136210 [Acnodon oligacanthus]